MTKILLPLDYAVNGLYGRNKTHKPLRVTETVEFEVPDISSLETVVAAKIETLWRSLYQSALSSIAPLPFDIRNYEGGLYVPLVKWFKGPDVPVSTVENVVREIDFPDIIARNVVVATPFSRPFGRNFITSTDLDVGARMCLTFEGAYETAGKLRIRSEKDVPLNEKDRKTWPRQMALESLSSDVNSLIFIDGVAWMKLAYTPVVRYHVRDEREAYVEVTLADDYVCQRGQFYALDRFEECLGLMEKLGLERGFSSHIKHLQVFDSEYFRVDDDYANLKGSLEGVCDFLVSPRKGTLSDTDRIYEIFDGDIPEKRARLEVAHEQFGPEEAGEQTANLVDWINERLPDRDSFSVHKKILKEATDRWTLRPVSLQLPTI